MLGPKQEAQAALFYEFSLEAHVPQGHLAASQFSGEAVWKLAEFEPLFPIWVLDTCFADLSALIPQIWSECRL
jgi:hypothetical protein